VWYTRDDVYFLAVFLKIMSLTDTIGGNLFIILLAPIFLDLIFLRLGRLIVGIFRLG